MENKSNLEINLEDIAKIRSFLENRTVAIADLVKESRLNQNLTIAQLAKRSHVSSTVITDLENARSLPRIEVLLKLAYCLDINFEKLFETFAHQPLFIQSTSNNKSKHKNNNAQTLETMVQDSTQTLEIIMQSSGLGRLDAKEVIEFIEFKKYRNKKRK